MMEGQGEVDERKGESKRQGKELKEKGRREGRVTHTAEQTREGGPKERKQGQGGKGKEIKGEGEERKDETYRRVNGERRQTERKQR